MSNNNQIKNKTLNIVYVNIHSLRNKQTELEEMAIQHGADILIITETWLYDNETQYIKINNFNSIFNRRNASRGGGTAIFIHEKLKFTIITQEKFPTTLL